MSTTSDQKDWSKPAAMAIPKGGSSPTRSNRGDTARSSRGRPRVTAFRSWRRSFPARGSILRVRANIEKTIAAQPDALAVLKLHYLRWVLFPIKGETYFMYQGIFDTDFDKYTEDAVTLFSATGISTSFENLEGFPKDWETNPPAFIKFVREHQCPSFLEYGEYPYVSADEIKKALRVKARSRGCSIRCNEPRAALPCLSLTTSSTSS